MQGEVKFHAERARVLAKEAERRLEENVVEAALAAATSAGHAYAEACRKAREPFVMADRRKAEVEAVLSLGAPESVVEAAGLANLSMGHSLASIATALGEGYLSAEVELVRLTGEQPVATQPVPVVPAPAAPEPGVLVPNQRVLMVDTEGHVWPDILKTADGAPYQGIAGSVLSIDEETDLVKVICDAPGTRVFRAGPTVQLHREQLRIPVPEGG